VLKTQPHRILPPTKEEVHVFARVCLSVCVVCMDLDEMLRVDRRREWTN